MRFASVICAAVLFAAQSALPALADEAPVYKKAPPHRHAARAAPAPLVPAVVAVPVRTVCDDVIDGLYVFRGGQPSVADVYQMPEPTLDRDHQRAYVTPFHGYVTEYPPPRPDPKPMPRLVCGKGTAIDGNNIRLGRQAFRLFGLQSPSRGETCPTIRGGRYNCGGAAHRELARHLAAGFVVCRSVEQEGDAILAAQCEVNGRDIGAAMVRDGFSSAQYRDSPTYVQREGEAVRASRGIWQAYGPSFDSDMMTGAAAYPNADARR